jgi:cyclopropane fatty-acyl-phospholipid synthase-like methyltransferase
MDSWNSIFKEKGKVFTKPHRDMKEILDLLYERNGKRILDLGCGTGRHLVYFAEKGFEVYGLDVAPEGIKIAKNWLKEKNLNCDLTLQKMEDTFPYQNSFFDAVISIQAMHHHTMKKIKFIVKEINRVIKRNGILFITVPILHKSHNDKGNWKLKKIEKGTFLPLSGPEKGLPHHFFTEHEIHKVFRRFSIDKLYLDRTKHLAVLGFKK